MVKVLFSTSNDLISKLIRWFTKGKVSHSAIETKLAGVPIVMHAVAGGVKIVPKTKWLKDNTLVASFSTKANLDSGIIHSVHHLGDKYDYVGLFGMIWVIVARWLGKKIKNPWASANAVICTEFVLHLDHNKLIKEWKKLDIEATTPQQLLDATRASHLFIEDKI